MVTARYVQIRAANLLTASSNKLQCDVWAVNRETGAAEVWINHWNDEISSGYLDYKGVVTGDVKCTEGWGVGLFDIGVSMADLEFVFSFPHTRHDTD